MVIVLTSTNVGQRVHVIHVLSALTQREVITVNAMKAFMGMEKHVVAKRSIFCKRVILELLFSLVDFLCSIETCYSDSTSV